MSGRCLPAPPKPGDYLPLGSSMSARSEIRECESRDERRPDLSGVKRPVPPPPLRQNAHGPADCSIAFHTGRRHRRPVTRWFSRIRQRTPSPRHPHTRLWEVELSRPARTRVPSQQNAVRSGAICGCSIRHTPSGHIRCHLGGESAVCVQRWNGRPLMNGAGWPGMPISAAACPRACTAHAMIASRSVEGLVRRCGAMACLNMPVPQVAATVRHGPTHDRIIAREEIDLVAPIDATRAATSPSLTSEGILAPSVTARIATRRPSGS